MGTNHQEEIFQLCRGDLRQTDLVEQCDAILKFVFTSPSVDELSVPLISRNVSVEAKSAWEILSYLSGARAALLDMKFVYIDEDENEFYLDDDSIGLLATGDSIAHPTTGEQLHDVDESVSPVFFPTLKLRDLRGESS